MSKPVIFVIGASGSIGTATLQVLSSKYGDRVEIRAGVRDPDKAEKVKAIPGVNVVKAAQGDKTQLVTTFAGVTSLFIVVPGAVKNREELCIKTAEAAKEAQVKHLLVLSGGVVEHTDTLFGRQFAEIEGTISKLGVPYTFFRLPWFFESYFMFGAKETIQKESTINALIDPTVPYDAVAVADAGKAAAVILADPSKHANKTYDIISESHSYNDVAKAFSNAIGKQVTVTRNTFGEVKKSMLGIGAPEWQVDGLIEALKLMESRSLVSNMFDFKKITGEEPTSLKSWLDTVAVAFK